MDVEADVLVGDLADFTGVHAHANGDLHVQWPGVRGQLLLDAYGSRQRVTGAAEDREE
jgi:hypothetical protein